MTDTIERKRSLWWTVVLALWYGCFTELAHLARSQMALNKALLRRTYAKAKYYATCALYWTLYRASR